MVSKFINGTSIKGALNYNEKKVKEGKAELISVEGYGLKKEQLSFSDKLARLHNLTTLRPNVKYNCVHVSLNFDPAEQLSNERLIAIATAYLEKTGFKEQPFLVYKHTDAAHPHIHLLTTNITADGGFINLHNIGRTKSEIARKEIEKEFGLIPAEGREQKQEAGLKPVPEAVIYGKSETKAAISKVVRTITREYKYTSLAELNSVLRQYNVTACRGEEDAVMYAKKGLVYSVLDSQGNKTGVPIKASSIYTKPTLDKLERYMENNKKKLPPYKARLRNIIDKALSRDIRTIDAFVHSLKQQNIDVVFRKNDTLIYGMTFIDKSSKTVIKGSALGKEYGAAAIIRRIGMEGIQNRSEQKENRLAFEQALKNSDFSKGTASVVAHLYGQGFRLQAEKTDDGDTLYYAGSAYTKAENYIPVSKKLAAYLQVNGISEKVSQGISESVHNIHQNPGGNPFAFISQLSKTITELIAAEQAVSQAPLPTKAKKKRRKANW